MSDRICDVQDCLRPHNARGYCFGHYERWKKLGHPDVARPLNTKVSPTASLHDRIARRIDKGLSSEQCWEWRGALGGKKSNGIGYGKFTVRGKQYDAHRVAWELHHERAIPVGMHILHACDNPLCVNPRHIEIGSNADNVADMVSKRRQTYGERNPQAILTDKAVREIRSSCASLTELANKYCVTTSTIRKVKSWRSWKHVG